MRQLQNVHAPSDTNTVTIAAVSQPNPAGAVNHYRIDGFNMSTSVEAAAALKGDFSEQSVLGLNLFFQSGNPAMNGFNGITLEVLLAVAIDRLDCLQKGQYPSHFNDVALYHMKKAQEALHDRTESLQPVAAKAQSAADAAIYHLNRTIMQVEYFPILTPDNSDIFVNPNVVYGEDLKINGAPASTGPIVFNKIFNIREATDFRKLFEDGLQSSDDIITGIALKAMYMSLPNITINSHTVETSGPAPVIKFDVEKSNFMFNKLAGAASHMLNMKGSVVLTVPKDVKSANEAEINEQWHSAQSKLDGVEILCHLDGHCNQNTGEFRLGVGGVTIQHLYIDGKDHSAVAGNPDWEISYEQNAARRHVIAVMELAQWVGFDPLVKREDPTRKPITAASLVEIPKEWPGTPTQQ